MLDPRPKLLPAPIIHAGLAPLAALTPANEEGAALRIEICLGQVQGLGDPKSRAPQHDQAGVGAEAEHLAEQVGQGLLVAGPKAGDRGVVWDLVGADHAEGDVLAAAALDPS